MIKDNFDIENKMMFLNHFPLLSVLEEKKRLFNSFESLFNDGGTMEYYNNNYENQNIKRFFNHEKLNLFGWC